MRTIIAFILGAVLATAAGTWSSSVDQPSQVYLPAGIMPDGDMSVITLTQNRLAMARCEELSDAALTRIGLQVRNAILTQRLVDAIERNAP